MSRLGIRRRLFVVVVCAVGLALAALLAGFNVLLDRNLSRDADNLARARAAATLAQLTPRHGRIVLGEAPDAAAADAPVWVFSGGRTLEAPPAGARVAAAARRLAAGPARLADVSSADTRLYAAPVVAGGRRLGSVVAAVSLAPYEQTRRTALIASLAFGAAVLLLVAVAARWLLASSLRPVLRMTRQAAAWSEHDLDQRFGVEARSDELGELAATLDGLLDRLAASLRREQRFSAELSHELRTPLARVLAESELALRRERTPTEYRAALELIHRNAAQLTRTVDALVAAARHESGAARGTADAYAVAAEAAAACADLAAARELELNVDPPAHPVRLGVEAELAERILQPVLDNACRYGRRHVRVSIARAPSGVVYTVDDDGPGVATDERERIFEPGVRGHVAGNGAGAGLGLALARRLARSAAGDVEAAGADGGGRFLVRLPAG
ncbi:MAG TPA: HAMP domain-containing sensor histidine kinase [Gaiellaceae bacterium]|nr:HAMP domain-containing sensor histidine kinase [Gaiellaceae bacterium]